MHLLERETQLAQLTKGYDHALRGHGRLLLVHGEAGVGKSSLVQQFLAALPATAVSLVAGCESLSTARPFGPLIDLAEALPSALAAAVREAGRSHALFPDVLAYLRRPPNPKVLVIEDLHWADAGTLDLVRYIARRLVDAPVLFLTTHRDDDLESDHPLRRLLGDLPTATTMRVAVPPLSQTAVLTLARTAEQTGEGLHAITGGNPFFVTEVLNCRDSVVPPSVYDATLNRLSRLTSAARSVAELVAISPRRIERSIVYALIEQAPSLMDECVEKGVLRVDTDWITFRHELARQAVEQSLRPGRSAALHRSLFTVLGAQTVQTDRLSRLVHHAQLAQMHAEILILAPEAARAASEASAHREAAKHYTLACRHADDLDPPARAELFEQSAEEYRMVSDVDATIEVTRAALELRTALGDSLHQGMNLRRLAVALRERGDRIASEAAIARAVEILEQHGPSTELVRSYAVQSRMRAWTEYTEAARIGERALTLAEGYDEPACLVEALHACMAARMYLRDDRIARGQLERALEIAIEASLEDMAAQAFVALQLAGVIYRDHSFAIDMANRGLVYCEARDLDSFVHQLVENRALSLFELGRWDEAEADLARCLTAQNLGERLRNSLLFLQARLDARRGLTGCDAYWRMLERDPEAVPMGYRVPAIATACAEAAWLRGDRVAAQQAVRTGIATALANTDARLLGPLLVWARRCGVAVRDRALDVAPMHACELAGDIAAAAAHWEVLGCRYDRALALLHGNTEQIGRALQEFEALGAAPAADIARQRLRAMGIRRIKRGPQPRTQADPNGLTARERQIYELLQDALSNAEIAQRLHRSERTIEHHVAAVFAKLGVGGRQELLKRSRNEEAAVGGEK
jgi:predicted ATPase/DNA-binding CsgD family transcriptional regulator